MFTHMNSNVGRFLLVTLAFFLTAKLALMVPNKESIVTLIWLPTGITAGVIMRWGKLALPAIFIAAFSVEITIDLPPNSHNNIE